jgi:hypothetical protein
VAAGGNLECDLTRISCDLIDTIFARVPLDPYCFNSNCAGQEPAIYESSGVTWEQWCNVEAVVQYKRLCAY